jgi:hypothetical protein
MHDIDRLEMEDAYVDPKKSRKKIWNCIKASLWSGLFQ